MAYDVTVEKEITKSRAEVFNALMDFGGVKALLPDMVARCDCTGSGVGAVREIELADGGRVVERLDVAINDQVFAYSITENNALPLTNYFAVVTLSDASNGTKVNWSSNWIPNGASSEEIVEMLQGLYGALIDGIAA